MDLKVSKWNINNDKFNAQDIIDDATLMEEFQTESEAKEAQRVTNETTRGTNEANRVLKEAERVASEDERVANELERVGNEEDRETNEATRITNETDRVSKESTRQANETARINNENTRGTSESARVSAENTRSSNESTRVTSEATRVSNESQRTTDEATRVTAENTRKSSETSRVNAETTRGINENTRISAENNRVTAESSRASNENTRQTNETNRNSAETSRVNAESSRASAEAARVTAEANRVSGFNSLKTAYEGAVASQSNVEVSMARQDGNSGITYPDLRSRLNATEYAPVIRETIPSGFVKIGDLDFTYMSTNPNTIKFLTESIAFVNGFKVVIPAGTVVTGSAPPSQNPREDLVFLEVWLDQSTGVPQNRIRVVDGVDFNTYTADGFRVDNSFIQSSHYNSKVTAQGANASPIIYSDLGNNNIARICFYNNTVRQGAYDNVASNIKLNDAGLYMAGQGDQTSKDALKSLDGYVYAIPMFRIPRRPSCGYMTAGEYDKVSPLINPIHLQRVVNNDRVAHSNDSLKVTVDGRLPIVNLLGSAGNCEKLSDWLTGGNVSLDSSIKLFGSYSFKGVLNGSTSGSIYKDIQCDQTHKYLISSHFYITSVTTGNPRISARDYQASTNPTTINADNTKLNQWQRTSVIITGKSGGGMRVFFGDTTATDTLTFYMDGICIYDLTYLGLDSITDIPTLEKMLPFVDGVQASKAVAIKATGKNLFDGQLEIGNIDSASGQNTSSTAVFRTAPIPVKSAVTYSALLNATYITNGIMGYDRNKSFIGLISPSFPITTPANCVYIRIRGRRNDSVALTDSDLTAIKSSLQLEESATATTYQDFKASQKILPSGIIDSLKAVGGVNDTVDLVNKKVVKRISNFEVIDKSLTYGIATESQTNCYVFYVAGYVSSSKGAITNTTGTAIGYSDDGNYSGVNHHNADIRALYLASNTNLYIAIEKSKINAAAGADTLAKFMNYIAQYPIKMIYQLATPIETDISDLIKGRLYVNPETTTFEVEQVSTDAKNPVAVANAVTNGNFVDVTGWSSINGSLVVSNNTANHTGNGGSNGPYITQDTTQALVSTSKYYTRAKARVTNSQCNYIDIQVQGTSVGGGYREFSKLNTPTQDTWYTISGINTLSATATGNLKFIIQHVYVDAATANGKVMEVQQAFMIDLTSIFGAGNEPDQAWCDKYLEFGTNYAVIGTVGTTALGVQRDGKDVLLGVNKHVGVIPSSKYKAGRYELLYREAPETHVPPKVTVAIGSQTLEIKDGATVGSMVLTNTEVGFKKHGDGSLKWEIISGFKSDAGVTISTGQEGYVNITTNNATVPLQVGDILASSASNSAIFKVTEVLSPTRFKAINLTVTSLTTTSMVSWTLRVMSRRTDNLYADIIAQNDLTTADRDLRHLVSLTGFNNDYLMNDSFNKLIAGTL